MKRISVFSERTLKCKADFDSRESAEDIDTTQGGRLITMNESLTLSIQRESNAKKTCEVVSLPKYVAKISILVHNIS